MGATSFVRDLRTPIYAGHMAGVKRRTGKRSEPAQNKNGGCLYIVAIVPEKNLIIARQTFYTFYYLYIKGNIIFSNRTIMQ